MAIDANNKEKIAHLNAEHLFLLSFEGKRTLARQPNLLAVLSRHWSRVAEENGIA
jgi:hypothetical protein